MFDPSSPISQRVFAELEKEGVRKDIYRYARWRTKDYDEANDLVADAIELICDPDKKQAWDPEKRSLFRHMRRVMDDMAITHARIGAGRFEINETKLVAKTGDPEAMPDAADEGDLPDERTQTKRDLAWLRELAAILLQRMSDRGDKTAIAVYEAACIYEEPAEQARHLGIPVAEVYEAHRRLRFHGLIVKAEWEQAERERMAALRARRKITEEKPS